jgi:hypothetical protein
MENDLHIEAGLTYAGENEEGEIEWIGTEKQWEAFRNIEMANDLEAKQKDNE